MHSKDNRITLSLRNRNDETMGNNLIGVSISVESLSLQDPSLPDREWLSLCGVAVPWRVFFPPQQRKMDRMIPLLPLLR